MHSALRIIDANANRASEGVRVLEDVARFQLADVELSGQCKALRHELRLVVEGLPGGRLALLSARDTPGDVGTAVKVSGSEERREGLAGVTAANATRAAEALRAIEEALKVVGGDGLWRRVEALRYRLYEVDRRIEIGLGTGRAVQWRLCVLVTRSMCKRPWTEVVAQAIAGGADCVQLREKGVGDGTLLRMATDAIAIAAGRAAVIINDRADVALSAGAHGVHLGQGDLPVSAVRAIAGDRLLIGVSTHDMIEAHAALREGADYAGVGAMFATATKPRAVSGVEYLRGYLELTRTTRPLPHLAIGGITPENVSELVIAGCRGIAVSSVVCASDDPAGVCRALLERIGGGGVP